MKNIFFTSVILVIFSLSAFSQDEDFQPYGHLDFSTDIKSILDAPEGFLSLNFSLEAVDPIRIAGENHKNFRHGARFGVGVFVQNNDDTLGTEIVTGNIGYVIGYEYPISKQLSFFPSLKPTLNFTALIDNNANDGEGSTTTNFSFSGLVGLKARYYFSEEGNYGISAETLSSFEGGYGFLLGITWRSQDRITRFF